jgi:hypothetical protein
VKFFPADNGRLKFKMDRKEKTLLFQVLGFYPLIPVSHHQLSKSGKRPEDQQLLEQAVASQRAENKKRISALLVDPSVLKEEENDFHLTLEPAHVECLLQALNDVRVGSWLRLGSPEELEASFAALNEETAPYFWSLEVAGFFEMALLKASTGGASTSAGG